MAWVNQEVAARLAEIAEFLRLRDADVYRVRAYERAASTVESLQQDLSTLTPTEIGSLKGIGSSSAAKINEYLETGTIGLWEELRGEVPAGVLALTRVPGLGPKTAKVLYEELGVDSVEALSEAIAARRVRGLRGLGPKTEENLAAGIERMGAKDSDRLALADVVGLAEELCARLARVEGVGDVEATGSLRRMRETVGDIDVLVASRDPGVVHAVLRQSDLVVRVLAAGEKKTSVLTSRGLQADLRVVDPDAWGAALVYFTGSKAHNVRIRERAVRRGLSLSEYGLFERPREAAEAAEEAAARGGDRPAGRTAADAPPEGAPPGRLVAARTEEDVYAALDLPWIPPPLREDTGEVEAAAAGRLPRVVTVADVRGDLHGHSDWSGDGKVALERLLDAAVARGYEYWAVTDHAENLTMNGLSRERMSAQRGEVTRLQERYPRLAILHGAELNIDEDGGVDYDAEFLAGFDFTVASIHTLFSRPPAAQTKRLLQAMANPYVNVIGHPTGRKVGLRPGYEFDLDEVVAAAAETGTALEVNANPRRLDLSGDMVRRAVDAGAPLAISCDAHRLGELDNLRYGVATAQRGWATPSDVINCRGLSELRAFVAAKRA